MSEQLAEVGVIGMAVMGSSLARNMAHKGYRVALFNRTYAKTEHVMAEHEPEDTNPRQLSAEEKRRILLASQTRLAGVNELLKDR